MNSLQLHLKLFYIGRVGLDEHSKLLNYELSFSVTENSLDIFLATKLHLTTGLLAAGELSV